MEPITYTPQQPKQQAAPPSQYVLVNDVTGKPPPKRGPQVLKAYTQEKVEDTKERKQIILEFKVPYPPKEKCKRCKGRGYEGTISYQGQHAVCICKKCYPML
jgi:hypothetical protein